MPYQPPTTAWDLRDFTKASLPVIQERTVDCSNCPVNLACTAGDGGTQYTCRRCGTTGYFTGQPENTGLRGYLILDCGKHRFNPGQMLASCTLCTGDVMSLYLRSDATNMLYVRTVHSRIPLKTRLKVLQDSYKHWMEHGLSKKADDEAR